MSSRTSSPPRTVRPCDASAQCSSMCCFSSSTFALLNLRTSFAALRQLSCGEETGDGSSIGSSMPLMLQSADHISRWASKPVRTLELRARPPEGRTPIDRRSRLET